MKKDINPMNTDYSQGNEKCMKSIVGSALKALRITHNYIQNDIAKALRISISAYSHYECGDRIPDIITLIRISNLYSINVNYLIMMTCLDIASRNKITEEEIYMAFSHSRTMPENEANILSSCNRLSPANRENLMLFLNAALDNS